ncbi:MAG: CRISPR-associated endonuclease Cas3'' [Candidatus Hydrothermales bacterium]
MEIIAKYNKIPLKKHIEDLLVAVRCLPSKKLDYEKLKVGDTQINREYFERLLDYAIVFHDLGKVSPSFQKKVGKESFDIKIDNFPDVRHNILSLFFINKGKVKELVDYSESLYATFLSAIAFHHWKKDEKEYLLYLNENLIRAARILLENENGKKLEEALKRHLGKK